MLIGLSGRIGSGKTTIAEHLATHNGFTAYSFASPIKQMICTLTGCSMSDLDIQEFKNSKPLGMDITYRTLLQTLGTEWGRNLDPNFWLKILDMKLSDCKENIVIPEIRFDNEADFVREKGGVIIHIYPSLSDFQKRNNVQHEHSSEVPVQFEPEDFLLINEQGSLEQTFKSLSEILNFIKG